MASKKDWRGSCADTAPPQQLALRGRIILAAAAGKNQSQIDRELGICVDTVRAWRMRWIGLQAASLEEVPLSERLGGCSPSRTALPNYGGANLPDGGPGL
jgi:DNA-binding CsgD family transcriptional regulator